ncbi:MAG: SRPBCC family protein [Pseudomonadota bacterium]
MRLKSSLFLMLLCFVQIAVAHGPSRQKVTKSIVVAAAPDVVWAAIADFCSIEKWHPAVYKCDGPGGSEIGTERTLTLGEQGGPQILEELQKFDAEKMSLKYKISKTDMAALPVTTYSAFLSVAGNDDGTSTVTWRGGFYRGYMKNEPPEHLNDAAAVAAVEGVYDAGLNGIKELVEK